MRIPFFCLFALLVSIRFASADPLDAGVEVGAALNNVTLSGDTTGIETSTKVGVLAGGYASFPVLSRISVQPEVAYAQKHFAVKDTAFGVNLTEKWDFVEIPVLARINFQPMTPRGFYVVAGPAFSFLLRAKEQGTNEGSTVDEDLKDQLHSTDVSIVAGAGVMFGKWGVEGRYDAGLRDLNKDQNLGDLTIKQRTATLLLRWSFK